jgi:Cd(II)/Pb(II)-responsive transcriptional regulator
MKIGELARSTGTPVETVRYYEREGLLPAPARSEGNYRQYGAAQVERLGFIRNCRALDMTLDEIRVLLRFRDAPADNCAGVNTLLDGHIVHVADRIAELQALEKQLRRLRTQCRKVEAAADCGILGELSKRTPRNEHGGPVAVAHPRGSHRLGGS